MTIYEQLRRDEGTRLKPYVDTQGKLTIGVGRNLTDVGIDNEEANLLMMHDIAKAADSLEEHLDLNMVAYNVESFDPRKAVLLNMCFNLGIGGLLGFRKMLAAYKAGDWETAAKEMLDSKWAEQVGARAHRLSEQMRTGEWR